MSEGIVAIVSLFIILPSLIIGGVLAGKWFKLKNAELEIRRGELEVQKKKLEFLTAETNREILDKIDRN